MFPPSGSDFHPTQVLSQGFSRVRVATVRDGINRDECLIEEVAQRVRQVPSSQQVHLVNALLYSSLLFNVFQSRWNVPPRWFVESSKVFSPVWTCRRFSPSVCECLQSSWSLAHERDFFGYLWCLGNPNEQWISELDWRSYAWLNRSVPCFLLWTILLVHQPGHW